MSSLATVSMGAYRPRRAFPLGISEGKSLSEESDIISRRCYSVFHHFESPFSRLWVKPIVQFETYRQQWEEETQFTSSTVDIVINPHYQKIIGMGKVALPLILAELKKRPAHWFWALQSISGENPVRPEQRGRVKQMAAAWIRWGEAKGLI